MPILRHAQDERRAQLRIPMEQHRVEAAAGLKPDPRCIDDFPDSQTAGRTRPFVVSPSNHRAFDQPGSAAAPTPPAPSPGVVDGLDLFLGANAAPEEPSGLLEWPNPHKASSK